MFDVARNLLNHSDLTRTAGGAALSPWLPLKEDSSDRKVPVIEVFSSIQGEGIHAGGRHLFLRFDKCNIACHYCDELHKPSQNVSLAAIVEELERVDDAEGPHDFLSFTGGEPLLYPAAINHVCERLGKRVRYYLETNGNLPEKLLMVISRMDVVAMDIKLKSVSATENTFEANQRFLATAIQAGKEVFVKIVVGKAIDSGEFEQAVAVIRTVNKAIPLVLQPLTTPGEPQVSLVSRMLELQKTARRALREVRIIPRFHEIFQLR